MLITINAVLDRINCYGMGGWLSEFFVNLGQPLPTDLAWGSELRTIRSLGLIVTVRRATTSDKDLADQLILTRIEGDATALMPRNLQSASETFESAMSKLSTTTAGGSPALVVNGDTRVSYFLPGARVVELRFHPNGVGFDRILIARLGAPLDWRDPTHR